jgi:hypothetical protein
MVNAMLECTNDRLVFSFPEVHPDATLTIDFQRTLRIPDDGKNYPLPPGLGNFPLRHVDDYKATVPAEWVERGGVMLPLYQSEALWLQFTPTVVSGHGHAYPFAIKVSAGKRSAITGKDWAKSLREDDYVVAPNQKWIDGYVVDKNVIRQFVAVPLGSGFSVEEQLTGKAEFGGIQIEVFPMKRESFEKRWPKLRTSQQFFKSRSRFGAVGMKSSGSSWNTTKGKIGAGPQNYSSNQINYIKDIGAAGTPTLSEEECGDDTLGFDSLRSEDQASARGISPTLGKSASDGRRSLRSAVAPVTTSMGIGAGGTMAQQIIEDPYGYTEWDRNNHTRCFVHLANSLVWRQITNAQPPASPATADMYRRYGVPWFDYYDDQAVSVGATQKLKNVKSVKEMTAETGIPMLPNNFSVSVGTVIPVKSSKVRDGSWK